MATEKVYSRVAEAEEIIVKLKEKYPDELWMVEPSIITVLGIENKKRGKKSKKLAKVMSVKGAAKAVLKIHNVNVRYIIEVFWSDWNEWSAEFKQWVIFHELQHVGDEAGKIVRHDCEDFAMLVDVVGPCWTSQPEKLPNLLAEKVEFNLDLRANLLEYCEDNDIDVDNSND